MNKEVIPYEQALALKQLGFNEPCIAKYENIKCVDYGHNSMSITEHTALNSFNGIRIIIKKMLSLHFFINKLSDGLEINML